MVGVLAFAACGDSGGHTSTPDAPMTTGCTQPGQMGNAVGVGEFCTKGGGQCRDNNGAIFCTVDYVMTEDWYCTALCTSDNDCGDNAYCSGSGMGGRGCIPARCGGTPSDAGTTE
jgi:hypothetical protein